MSAEPDRPGLAPESGSEGVAAVPPEDAGSVSPSAASDAAALGAQEPDALAGEPAGDLQLGVWQPLDPRWVRSERVGWWLCNGVLLVTVAVGLGVWLNQSWWHGLIELALLPVVTLLSVNLGTRWSRLQYRHVRWRVTDHGLVIEKGVFWRRALHVPCTRVQHTDVVQGPVQRRFGVSTLAVHTAGTSNATVSLDGLAQSLAQAVRDHLLAVDRTDDI